MYLTEQPQVCGMDRNELLERIEAFHGFTAPGLVLGAFMVDLARRRIGEGVEADAIVESRHCLPDAVQIFTPCTIGNGWMKIMDWDKFALTLYDRHTLQGFRVWFDLEKAKAYPELYNWYMRLVPKKELPIPVLLDAIFRAGANVFSDRAVTVTRHHHREKKKTINLCSGCNEAYPAWQGPLCRACQGDGYYEAPLEKSASGAPAGAGSMAAGEPPLPARVCVEEAVGKRLIHDITEIRKGEFKGPAFRKGHQVCKEDIPHLRRLGKEHLYVETEAEGYVHEDEAASRMARAFCGSGVSGQGAPAEGKIRLRADRDGILKVATEPLTDVNMLGEVMCATRRTDTLVKAGDVVAATRAIPLLVRGGVVDRAVEIAGAVSGLVSVKPLQRSRVGVIITGNEVYHQIIEDQFEAILRSKVTELGSEVTEVVFAPDDAARIGRIIESLLASGVDLILSSGGMSVDPDDVTRNGVIEAGGKNLTYGSPVLPGAMFLFADVRGLPFLGVPACGMYHKTTILDLVLPRILAGERLERSDIAVMGHSGLCMDCKPCRFPNCAFGKY
jgi:formylmethanofuran dehydrogenase subunit E